MKDAESSERMQYPRETPLPAKIASVDSGLNL
jgi:hypothetical protein